MAERRSLWLLLPSLVLFVACFLLPIIMVFRWSFYGQQLTLEYYREILSSEVSVTILYRTIWFSLCAAAIATVTGYPAGYFIASRSGQSRTMWLLIVLLPLWISALIRTYSWLAFLGREGPLNRLFVTIGAVTTPLQLLYTRPTVYVAMVQVLLPIAITIIYAGMLQIDTSLVRAARGLGASPSYAFGKIFLPLSLSGAINALVLCFVISLGFFITPDLLGSRHESMIANLIAIAMTETLEWNLGAALGGVLLVAGLSVAVALSGGLRLLLMPRRGTL